MTLMSVNHIFSDNVIYTYNFDTKNKYISFNL